MDDGRWNIMRERQKGRKCSINVGGILRRGKDQLACPGKDPAAGKRMGRMRLWEGREKWTEGTHMGKPGLILSLELQFFLFKFQGNCHLVPVCLPVLSHLLVKPGR